MVACLAVAPFADSNRVIMHEHVCRDRGHTFLSSAGGHNMEGPFHIGRIEAS